MPICAAAQLDWCHPRYMDRLNTNVFGDGADINGSSTPPGAATGEYDNGAAVTGSGMHGHEEVNITSGTRAIVPWPDDDYPGHCLHLNAPAAANRQDVRINLGRQESGKEYLGKAGTVTTGFDEIVAEFFFRFNYTAAGGTPSTQGPAFFTFLDSSNTVVCAIVRYRDGAIGSTITATSTPPASEPDSILKQNTTYKVRIRYRVSTGASDGLVEIWVRTPPTWPDYEETVWGTADYSATHNVTTKIKKCTNRAFRNVTTTAISDIKCWYAGQTVAFKNFAGAHDLNTFSVYKPHRFIQVRDVTPSKAKIVVHRQPLALRKTRPATLYARVQWGTAPGSLSQNTSIVQLTGDPALASFTLDAAAASISSGSTIYYRVAFYDEGSALLERSKERSFKLMPPVGSSRQLKLLNFGCAKQGGASQPHLPLYYGAVTHGVDGVCMIDDSCYISDTSSDIAITFAYNIGEGHVVNGNSNDYDGEGQQQIEYALLDLMDDTAHGIACESIYFLFTFGDHDFGHNNWSSYDIPGGAAASNIADGYTVVTGGQLLKRGFAAWNRLIASGYLDESGALSINDATIADRQYYRSWDAGRIRFTFVDDQTNQHLADVAEDARQMVDDDQQAWIIARNAGKPANSIHVGQLPSPIGTVASQTSDDWRGANAQRTVVIKEFDVVNTNDRHVAWIAHYLVPSGTDCYEFSGGPAMSTEWDNYDDGNTFRDDASAISGYTIDSDESHSVTDRITGVTSNFGSVGEDNEIIRTFGVISFNTNGSITFSICNGETGAVETDPVFGPLTYTTSVMMGPGGSGSGAGARIGGRARAFPRARA